MKKFNFSKGLVIGLLTLALCLTCFAAVNVSADEEAKKVTFKATYDKKQYTASYELTEGAVTVPYSQIIADLANGTGDKAVKITDAVAVVKAEGTVIVDSEGEELEEVINPAVADSINIKSANSADVTLTIKSLSDISRVYYDPETDGIVFESDVAGVDFYYINTKKAEGTAIAGAKFNKVTTAKAEDEEVATKTVLFTDKPIKTAVNKTAYIYWTVEKPAADKTEYAPNLVVDGSTDVKKLTVNLNYAKAVEGYDIDSVIGSIVIKGEAETTYAYSDTDKTAREAFFDLLYKLQYSTDGKTWIYAGEGDGKPILWSITSEVTGLSAKVDGSDEDNRKLRDKGGLTFKYNGSEWNLIAVADDSNFVWNSKIAADVPDGLTVKYVNGKNTEDLEDGYNYATSLEEKTYTFTYDAESKSFLDEDLTWEDFAAENNLKLVGKAEDELTTEDKITITVTKEPFTIADFDIVVEYEEGDATKDDEFTTAIVEPAHSVFDGEYLAGLINASKASKLQFRIAGSEAVEKTGTNAKRPCKPAKVSVKVAKAGKAVKVDYKKSTIALKGGYDFMVISKEDAEAALKANKLTKVEELGNLGEYFECWITLLPFNKGGAALDAEKKSTYYMYTCEYVPNKKLNDSNAQYFTSEKLKSLTIDKVLELGDCDPTADNYILMRKSATVGAPAAKPAAVLVNAQAKAPKIAKDSKQTAYYAVSDAKGSISAPKLTASAGASTTYEYVVIAAADYANVSKIDWANVKWTKLGKIKVGSTSTKYGLVGGDADKHALGEGDYIFFRSQGAGSKTAGSVASDYRVAKVVKITVEEKEVYALQPVIKDSEYYVVTFKDIENDDNKDSVVSKVADAAYGAYTLPTSITGWTANEHEIIKWYADEEYTTPIDTAAVNIEGDTTFYATWVVAPKYTVTYHDATDGTANADVEVEEYSDVKYTVADMPEDWTAPTGKVFAGWTIEGSEDILKADTQIPLPADITLVAVWDDAGSGESGGSGEVTPTVVIKTANTEEDVTEITISKADNITQQGYKSGIVAIANSEEAEFTWTLSEGGDEIVNMVDTGAHDLNATKDGRTFTLKDGVEVGSTVTVTVTVTVGTKTATDTVTIKVVD